MLRVDSSTLDDSDFLLKTPLPKLELKNARLNYVPGRRLRRAGNQPT
jgi:hypothetical protein